MGNFNCKECVVKDSNYNQELCLGQDKQNSENKEKIYIDKAGNKSKHIKKDPSRIDEKNSEFSNINGEKLAMEDKEILTKIGNNFKKINGNEFDSQNNYNIYNSNPHEENNSQEGRYIDPYGQNYQEYDLSNLEYKQDSLQYDQNPGTYISYKELKIPKE